MDNEKSRTCVQPMCYSICSSYTRIKWFLYIIFHLLSPIDIHSHLGQLIRFEVGSHTHYCIYSYIDNNRPCRHPNSNNNTHIPLTFFGMHRAQNSRSLSQHFIPIEHYYLSINLPTLYVRTYVSRAHFVSI